MSDPHWSNVVALLHMDGAAGSTTFTDQRPNTWSSGGTAPVISTTDPRFGAGCGAFDGGRIFTTGLPTIGTQSYTIEFWFKPTLTPPTGGRFLLGFNGNAGTSYIKFNPDLRIESGLGRMVTYSPTLTLNAWNFIAITRVEGAATRCFAGGVSGTPVTMSSQNILDAGTLTLGDYLSTGHTPILGAFFDDFRYTLGVARYTDNFTPPDAQFPDSDGAVPIDTVLFGGLYPSATSALIVNNPAINDGNLGGVLSPYGALIVNNPEIIDGVISGEMLPHSDSAIYVDNPGPNTADLFGKLSPTQTSVILVNNPQVAPAPGAMSVQVLGQILLFSQLINEARVDGVLDLQGGLWQEVTTAGVLELLGSIQASIGSYVLVSGELALTNGVEERSLERQPAIDEASGDIEFVAPTLGRY